MIRALPRMALQLWIVLFIVFFGAEAVHLEPTLRLITQVLYGVPLAVWALLRLRGPADRLDWAVLGVLVVFALVCILSRDRTESLGTLALATAYAAWFGLMRRAGDLRAPIVVAVATGLGLTLAFNAYLLIREKVDWYVAVGSAPLEGVVTFPWESVNALPILVLIAVPFVAWVEPGRVRVLLAVVVGLSAVVVIPISQGRAGWTGLAVGALVLAALLPVTRRRVASFPRRRVATAGAAVATIGLLGLVALAPRLVSAIGESGRLLLWEQALNAFAASPLIGSGPGVYAWVRIEHPPAAADLLAVRLPHNVPLLTLFEGGVLLFVAMGAVLATWIATAFRAGRARGWQELLGLAALAGFGVASLLDDFSYLPAVIAAVLALAALLVPAQAIGRTPGWLAPAAFAIATVLALPNAIAVDVARGAAQDARTSMAKAAYGDAVASFGVATRSHPENGGYWLGLGMAAAYSRDSEQAVAAYERSIQVAPGDPRGRAALAHLGPAIEEVERLKAAAARTLDDPQEAARLGAALAARGDVNAATHAWGRAVALRPEILRLLPYESAGILMQSVANEAATAIRANPRPGVRENEAAIWDIALALDELPADAEPAWRAVDAARHGDVQAASDLAADAVAAAPYEARGHQATAAVAAFACDAEAERQALELERKGVGAYVEPEPEPRAVREFVYREASLGPSQPPGARLDLAVERWPWSLVDRPAECDG